MTNNQFADIILPLAVRGRFTYRIPDNIAVNVRPGVLPAVTAGNVRSTVAGEQTAAGVTIVNVGIALTVATTAVLAPVVQPNAVAST